MLPCPIREWFHIDCPGCGMQRAVYSLLKGDFEASVIAYPMLIPLIAMVLYLGLHLVFHFRNGSRWLMVLYIVNSAGIFLNYSIKLWMRFGG